ncbi:MAG: sigma factor-like helix-turn-helix DNA-binding protein [Aerococcus suis]|nr:sigma factor-like helix-turn-helix DNA-binding protein [Aerococcus suis]
MDIKDLDRVKLVKFKIEAYQDKMKEEFDSMTGLGAVDYAKEKVQGSQGNAIEERLARGIDRRNHYLDKIEELKGVYDHYFDIVNELDDPTKIKVILDRYFYGKEIGEIADSLNVSEGTIYRLHREAVSDLKEIDSNC